MLFRSYYFKIYKPKHEAPDLEDDYCEYEDGELEEIAEEPEDEDTPPVSYTHLAVYKRQLLILVCVAIYAVLIQSIATDGDPIGAIWGCVGYTVLLCFTLFKTSSKD